MKFSKQWIKYALIRAIKTFAQAFLAVIPTTAVLLNDVNWLACLSAAALSAVLSIFTSLYGLPEVDKPNGGAKDE